MGQVPQVYIEADGKGGYSAPQVVIGKIARKNFTLAGKYQTVFFKL